MRLSAVRKCWWLLDARERRNALKVLALMIVGAFASAAMVGSVFPFLSVLSDPDLIRTSPALAQAYALGGFTSDYGFLVALGVGAMALIVVSNLVLILNAWALERFTQMRVHSISRRLLAHYLAQPYAFFLQRHSGDMSTNILAEAQQVVSQFLRPMANLISSSLTILAVVATLIVLDPLVATSTIATFGLVYGGVMILTRRYVRRMGQRRARANEARFRLAGEALGGIKDVKLLGREAAYLARYSAPPRRWRARRSGSGASAGAALRDPDPRLRRHHRALPAAAGSRGAAGARGARRHPPAARRPGLRRAAAHAGAAETLPVDHADGVRRRRARPGPRRSRRRRAPDRLEPTLPPRSVSPRSSSTG